MTRLRLNEILLICTFALLGYTQDAVGLSAFAAAVAYAAIELVLHGHAAHAKDTLRVEFAGEIAKRDAEIANIKSQIETLKLKRTMGQ